MRTEGFLAVVAVTPIGATESVVSEREREAEAEMAAGDAIKIEAGSAAAPHPGPVDRRPGALVEPAGRGGREVPRQQPVGDLSIKDKKTPRDFVIKTADDAIWVTGMRPAGNGFRFDPTRRRDTGKWLRVYGRPWTSDGMVYLRAERLELADRPDDDSLEPVDIRIAEKEAREADVSPLRVVFSLPLDGERENSPRQRVPGAVFEPDGGGRASTLRWISSTATSPMWTTRSRTWRSPTTTAAGACSSPRTGRSSRNASPSHPLPGDRRRARPATRAAAAGGRMG